MLNRSTSPLVSIVCPTYNSSDYIALTIQSVLNQTYSNFELIIIDDCSTDSTIHVVSNYLTDARVFLEKLEINSGAAVARNHGIQRAAGGYIAFIDSDDLWDSEKLSQQVRFMQSFRAAVSYCEFDLIDESGKKIGRSQQLQKSVTYRQLLKHCIIQNSTAMYDTQLCGKVFCPPLRKRQDFGLFLAALKKCSTALLVTDMEGKPPALASYRLRAGSVSSNKLKNIPMQWRVYRDIEHLGFIEGLYFLSCWISYSGVKNLQRVMSRLF